MRKCDPINIYIFNSPQDNSDGVQLTEKDSEFMLKGKDNE